jgi:hypothetical protein
VELFTPGTTVSQESSSHSAAGVGPVSHHFCFFQKKHGYSLPLLEILPPVIGFGTHLKPND